MSHVLAGVALAQLETLQERVERRRQIFQRYQRNLEGLPGVGWMPEAGWNTATRWLSVMRLHPETTGIGPEDLRLRLQAHGIESRPVWKPLHQQPVLQGIRMFNNGVADQLFREGLCLPSGTAMTDEQVDEVSGILRDALAG
jgi:dTDP-4-amino-4,6-dideoxygalactose transaminase